MKWTFLSRLSTNNKRQTTQEIIKVLLRNRGLTGKREIEEFLNPSPPKFFLPGLVEALARVKLAIKNNEPIIVYGDYDADGICATAIMWEALNGLGAKVMPFIPRREKEGYGLSKEGIDHLEECKLLITVDNGIVANDAVDYAKKKGIDVVILDHHEKPKRLPRALAIVHTEKLCASGIVYFLVKELTANRSLLSAWLELAAIATVTDLMPLLGPNRSIVKHGLEALNRTERLGLRGLYEVAGTQKIGTYEIGFMIGPRLNASGRIEDALTALRLLCTKDPKKAAELAQILNATNRDRRLLLEEQTQHAMQKAKGKMQKAKIIVLEHESYHQGIIGLIAGKLVEKYYLPAIVISKGETVSKASARSISGFNIIEAIRNFEPLLVNAGGHSMAAGFSIQTRRICEFRRRISEYARKKISAEFLERALRVDGEPPIELVGMALYNSIASFAPYGIGNPEPVFASTVRVQSLRTVGADGKHLKLVILPATSNQQPATSFDAIAFMQGHLAAKIKVGDKISLAYNLALDRYNGDNKLTLKVKDIKYG